MTAIFILCNYCDLLQSVLLGSKLCKVIRKSRTTSKNLRVFVPFKVDPTKILKIYKQRIKKDSGAILLVEMAGFYRLKGKNDGQTTKSFVGCG